MGVELPLTEGQQDDLQRWADNFRSIMRLSEDSPITVRGPGFILILDPQEEGSEDNPNPLQVWADQLLADWNRAIDKWIESLR